MTDKDPLYNYTVSLAYDRRLYRQDIAGSIAHARMLARQGIITDKEAELMVMGLGAIRQEIEEDAFPWRPEPEDLHMNIEARLTQRIGDVGGKLHTARSRNDQVATDLRLYTMEVIQQTLEGIRRLQGCLLDQAEAHTETILPGYTHLQRAQPVLLAHHLLAYFQMLQRDAQRFREARARADVLPLGSGALAGSPYPLDREWVVFIEVKTRRGSGFGTPAESVTPLKQRKMARTALAFLAGRGWHERPCRFDVVEVVERGKTPEIRHIQDAFRLGLGA